MKLVLGYFQKTSTRYALSVTDSLLALYDDLAVQLVPRATVEKLVEVWERWHLNDMNAACEHQRALGWTWKTHPEAECPTCGYKLGHAWLFEALPSEVIAWLEGLSAPQPRTLASDLAKDR